jgi:hypothetical protein
VLFVYRSHYRGPWSKLVRELPDATVLDWFHRGWDAEDPDAWIKAELGTAPYGLHTIFDAGLRKPSNADELLIHLRNHLYVEGPADRYIRMDEHSLRVRTDDDEVELAYFFLDDHALAAHPDRLAYVVADTALPATFTDTEGEPTTFAVFLTFYDSASFDCAPPSVFPGVTLPGLAAHLRASEPDPDSWPPELLVLRNLIAPGDETIRPALERCNRWPGFNLNASVLDPAVMELTSGRRPELSRLEAGEHLAQLAMHRDEHFGFQQWYLFDTNWAAAHPDLASSLLRYATDWDPLG